MHVTGRLSAAGPGLFYWHGRIEGDVALECTRCLAEAHAHVSDETHLIFAEAGAMRRRTILTSTGSTPNAQELDLRPAIREQWLLVGAIVRAVPGGLQGVVSALRGGSERGAARL